jgi:multidrug resistance efflux pump
VIAFITLCYCGLVWLIFVKLKLAPWNRGSQATVAGVGLTGLLVLVVGMNLYQPYSKDVRVYQYVVEILPRVTGRVIEVPVKPHAPVQQGDVLFRVDPRPFQYQVDDLTARLFLAQQRLEESTALVAAGAGERVRREHYRAEVDQYTAQLANAKWSLEEATVHAPADGIVTNLSLRPGQVASQMASLPVMSLIVEPSRIVIASFSQTGMRHIRPGDPAEVALDRHPGRIFAARVDSIVPATGQGQISPSGQLMEWTQQPPRGRFAVRLQLEEEAASGVVIPGGAAGNAAVYTQKWKVIRIIRKVVIRIYTWLNYVFAS